MALYAYPSSRSTAPPLFPSSLPSNHSATAAHLSLPFLLHLLPASSLLARSSSKQLLHFFHSIAVFSNIPLASTAWFPTSTPLDSSPCLSLSLSSSFSNSPRWHQRPLCSSLDTEQRLNANHRAATGPWLFSSFRLPREV